MSKFLRKISIIIASMMVCTSFCAISASADTIDTSEETTQTEIAGAENAEEAPVIDEITSVKNDDGTVTFTVKATGGDFGNGKLFYKFYQLDDNGKKIAINQDENIGQNYSTENTFVCQGTDSEKFKIEVCVQDSNNETVSETSEYTEGEPNEDDAKTLSITTLNTDKSTGQLVNTSIKVSATVSNADGDVQYKFSVKDSSGKETTIQDYSDKATSSWKPTTADDYTLIVKAKDSTNKEVTKTKSFKIKAEDEEVTELEATIKATTSSAVKVGDKITLKASATGQTGDVTYEFIVLAPSGTKTIQKYSPNASVNYTVKEEGNYKFYVNAKDGNGTDKSNELTVGVTKASTNTDDPKDSPTFDNNVVLPIIGLAALSFGFVAIGMKRKSNK